MKETELKPGVIVRACTNEALRAWRGEKHYRLLGIDIDTGIRVLWQVEELETGKTKFIFLPEGSYEVVDEDKIKGMLAGKQTGII